MSRSRSRVRYMYLSYQIRCIGLGKWKRRCHGCSDVRHDVQRTSLGGQIEVETGTMCGLCGWNFEARPATTTGDWKTQANAAQHSGPPLFRLLTHLHNHNHNNNNETRPTSSPLPSERGTTSHHAIDDRSATSSSINHSVQSRALHASSLVKQQQQQQQQHCPASITPPRNPRDHVRSSDLHAMAVLHSQRPQSRSTSSRAAAADLGTIISLALRH